MLALNHAATGAILALTIKDPVVAVPLAFASHFILDTLPHFSAREAFGILTPKYNLSIIADFSSTIIMTIIFAMIWPQHIVVLVACVIAATLPDYVWPFEAISKKTIFAGFFRFHRNIQRFESVKGIFVEAVWIVGSLMVLSHLHR